MRGHLHVAPGGFTTRPESRKAPIEEGMAYGLASSPLPTSEQNQLLESIARRRRWRGQKLSAFAGSHVGTLVHTARVFSGDDRSGKLCAPHINPVCRRMVWRRFGGVYSRSHTYIRDHFYIRTDPNRPGQLRHHHDPRRPDTRHSCAYDAALVQARDGPCFTVIVLPASGCPTPHGSGAPLESRRQADESSGSL